MRHQVSPGDIDPDKLVVIRKIRKLMDFWRIQPHELRGRPTAVPQVAATAQVRYRHPVSGQCWDGLGSQPEWLRLALLREGYTVEELRPGREPSPASVAADPAE